MKTTESYTSAIRTFASELGFDHCGIARAERLDDDARRLENWLNKGMHGSMKYMENHFELRVDPGKLVPGAKSVITLLLNYYPQTENDSPHKGTDSDAPARISKYAYGEDYHEVIREKLNILLRKMRERFGDIQGRGFVDSAPVLERAWAKKSGLGWIGRNGNLITKDGGSFFFISTLIVDIELTYDDPYAKDFCGTCTRCVDACPTEAIYENKIVNGSKCISYFTIELKEMLIPAEMRGRFNNWAFGCDVCQDVCPWNRFAKPHNEQRFQTIPGVLNFSTMDWEGLTEDSFRTLFKNSPLKRAKLQGLQRNLRFIRLNSDLPA